jgi:hypothetical protein
MNADSLRWFHRDTCTTFPVMRHTTTDIVSSGLHRGNIPSRGLVWLMSPELNKMIRLTRYKRGDPVMLIWQHIVARIIAFQRPSPVRGKERR